MLPLEGMTVVALEHVVAAPFATRQLADLGARVIKIERPGIGDHARYLDESVRGLSSHFVWLNRSKESLSLDLKQDESRQVLEQLLGEADVFIQNLAPGAASKLGLGAERLRRVYPSLIVCDISGYGSSGPYRDKKAYDLLVQCETGVVSLTGTPETPSKIGIAIADIACGMYAYSGILAALLRRERTGEGATVEVSLFEALAEWMGFPAYYTLYGGSEPQRSGTHHASIAPYGPCVCGDGEVVFLAVQNDREWGRFCKQVLGEPGLISDERFETNSRRVENRSVLERRIAESFAGYTSEEVTRMLDEAAIGNAHLRDVRQFLEHPQLEARGRWKTVDSPAGPLRMLGPVGVPDAEARSMGPIPEVGEHTEAILYELGFDAEALGALRRAEAI